jgi:hypothetical protein
MLAGVHLVGSVPLTDTETVFRTCASRLGRHVRRLPDGETGERDNYVVWQLPKLQAQPDLETVPPPSPEYGPSVRVRPAPGLGDDRPARLRGGGTGVVEGVPPAA